MHCPAVERDKFEAEIPLQVNPTHSARAIHISPDPDPQENTITRIPSLEIPKAQIKKHFSSIVAVQCSV